MVIPPNSASSEAFGFVTMFRNKNNEISVEGKSIG